MKKMDFEQMENIQGGVNCFLVGVGAALTIMAPGGPVTLLFDPYYRALITYCWNS